MSTTAETQHRESTHRWFRWAFLGAALLLFLILLAHVLWGSYAERRLEAQVARLRDEGEPMTLEQLALPVVPDAANASLDYQAAGKSIDTSAPAFHKWSSAERGHFQFPLTDDERATFNAIVGANAAAMKLVMAARDKQAGQWGDKFTKPYFTSTLDFTSSRNLAELLNAAAYTAHAAGRDHDAVEHVHDLLRLANASMNRPTLIAHLVAVGISALGADTASAIAVDLHAPRPQVEALLRQLQEERAIFDSRRLALRSERIFELEACYNFVDGVLSPNAIATPPNTGQRLVGYAIKPLAMDDGRQAMIYVQDVLKATEAPDWPTAQRQMPTAFMKEVEASPIRHMMARLTMPALDRVALSSYLAIAKRRLGATALAVRLYALDHDGQLPRTLEALVPRYLPAVPIDPLSGQAIRYINEAKNPRIYSVGRDGVDDGGKPEAQSLGTGRYGWKGDDVVNLTRQPREVEEPDGATTQP